MLFKTKEFPKLLNFNKTSNLEKSKNASLMSTRTAKQKNRKKN